MAFLGPKKPDHPSVGKLCRLCGIPFAAGDMTGLVVIRPANEVEAAKARARQDYIAEAVELHAACIDATATAFRRYAR